MSAGPPQTRRGPPRGHWRAGGATIFPPGMKRHGRRIQVSQARPVCEAAVRRRMRRLQASTLPYSSAWRAIAL